MITGRIVGADKKKSETKERGEGSFVFSLAELSRMEADRLRAEADAARVAREALELQREEAAARARDEERRAAEAAEARARDEEARDRLEQARIEAERAATLEAARIAAEAAARAAEDERRRRHDLEIEKARLSSRYEGKRRVVVGAVCGAIVAMGAALAAYALVLRPDVDRRIAAVEARATEVETRFVEPKSHADAVDQRLATAEGELQRANAANKQLLADLEAAKKTAPPRAAPPVSGHVAGNSTNVPPVTPPQDVIPPGFHRCPAGTRGDPTCW